MHRLLCLTAGMLAGLTACHQPATDTATTYPAVGAPSAEPDPRYVLTGSGDYVLSSAPPGVEVRVGSKLLYPEHLKDAAVPADSGTTDRSD